MSNKQKQWGAIIIMIALFAMIAFVTNLCSPMAVIVKNQFGASNLESQIGNYGNFIAYLVMGIPSGMLIKRFGYKVTALLALLVGVVGIFVQWMSGWESMQNMAFAIYLVGAFIGGFCMCMLNTVVNPMLNILGGGGNKGNQLIQIGGVFNSGAAVAVYILMGALIGDAAKARVSDATPALFIAGAIFIIAFFVLLFSKIEEPHQAENKVVKTKDPHSAFSFRHFNLGILAIFLYMGLEVGTPTYILQYLTGATEAATPGLGMDAALVGQLVAIYWLLMLVGRFIGGSIGGKVSSKQMIVVVASLAVVLTAFGMFAPTDWKVNIPGIDWANLSVAWAEVPVGIFAFILIGLCTSVMWGGIFNLAVEGLGKYTAIASGAFMTMVFGCAVMVALQGWIADVTGSYLTSYWVVLGCAAYILFYALVGSKNVNTDIPVGDENEKMVGEALEDAL